MRSGAILMSSATPDRVTIPGAGSFGRQCAAVESFSRALAVGLGPRRQSRLHPLRGIAGRGLTDVTCGELLD